MNELFERQVPQLFSPFTYLWHLVTLWKSNAMFLFLNISESYLNEDPQLFQCLILFSRSSSVPALLLS